MSAPLETPVLVVGAGPTGLALGTGLGQLGLASLVVERRDGPQRAPAAHVVNARTFEILRAMGVDPRAIAAASRPPAESGLVRFVTTLVGEELGSIPFERQGDDALAVTPTPLRNLSQHRLEGILLTRLRAQENAQLRFSCEWESAVQDVHGVTSRLRDLASGEALTVRSRWLLAADGAGSRVRKALGIEPLGPPRLASFVMIHLAASFRALVAERPGILYFLNGPAASGVFVAHDPDAEWVYMHPWDPEREPAETYDEARCAEIVHQALGAPAPPFRIETISTWHMSVQVAERYREGRAFLVGDAAHRFPPTGGLGLNTGVQDAHNLAWKLAFVEHGLAGEALLDSYEAERKPVAHINAETSAKNAARLFEVQQALGPDFAGDREKVRAAVERQAEHFDMPGLQLGFRYEQGALVPDGAAPPRAPNPVREYVPNACPGSRLPHAWTERGSERVSTLDLLAPDRFTLVAGRRGGAWLDAAQKLDLSVVCLALGREIPDASGGWGAQLGLEADGALLVRPDHHVAWRSARGVADPDAVLREALARILGR